jgi:hypothetical protein
MFIPYSNFSHPGSASKNLSILTPNIVPKLSEIWSGLFISRIRIPDPYFYPSRIPEPGVKKGTGSRIRILNMFSDAGDVLNSVTEKYYTLHK